MDAFVSRKRRKLESREEYREEPKPKVSTNDEGKFDDDESTDFKLAILASLHPDASQQALLDVLLAHGGYVEAASLSLAVAPKRSRPKSPPRIVGYQSSLASFADATDSSAKQSKLLSKKGKTLHLFSPEDVEAHTPCSIIHNFLPPDEANALLKELLEEAPTFKRDKFKLFDNVVQSPHTSCFYVSSLEEVKAQKTEYVYNGDRLTDVRQILPHMRAISSKVQSTVNAAIQERIRTHHSGKKLKHQPPDPWVPNAAVVNCYAGPAESVGWHSDQVTYLGPRCTIGSLSLGVAREFRVRRIVPVDSDAKGSGELSAETTADKTASNSNASTGKSKSKSVHDAKTIGGASDAGGQISIHLPHNSLLIMHAEMQEGWKHTIVPSLTVTPHPIAGTKRINITYRDYKDYLHPRYTPRCKCGEACILRVVQRKKENHGRYFWMCYVGNVPGKNQCGFFEWAEFDDNGRPIWKNRNLSIPKNRAEETANDTQSN